MASSKEIVFYHYTFSPFARRVVWYMNLRNIPYSQCLQPPIMPRPDLAAIGVEYRRIPVMAIGRDIYLDTRLIIEKLETLFPSSTEHPSISATTNDQKALERLLSLWTIDAGIFVRASQLIPTSAPLLKDAKFTKDREQLSGRSWSAESIEKNRPEAVAEIKNGFAMLENTLLADGRDWVLGTEKPSLADIEAVWPYHWLSGLKGALPPDQISATQFPKVFAWIDRFQQSASTAAKKHGKPKTVKGAEAAIQISASEYAESLPSSETAATAAAKNGQQVQMWPIDSGFSNKDSGVLLAANEAEFVIETTTKEGKTVRVHAPRHGFRMKAIGAGTKL